MQCRVDKTLRKYNHYATNSFPDENRARFFSRKLDTDVPPPEIDKKGETELMIETCGIFLILLFLLNPITWSLLGKDTER